MLRDVNRLRRPLSHPLAVDGEDSKVEDVEEPLSDCGEGRWGGCRPVCRGQQLVRILHLCFRLPDVDWCG
jgi:hypothetical protein